MCVHTPLIDLYAFVFEPNGGSKSDEPLEGDTKGSTLSAPPSLVGTKVGADSFDTDCLPCIRCGGEKMYILQVCVLMIVRVMSVD